jgi:hypothetical protein
MNSIGRRYRLRLLFYGLLDIESGKRTSQSKEQQRWCSGRELLYSQHFFASKIDELRVALWSSCPGLLTSSSTPKKSHGKLSSLILGLAPIVLGKPHTGKG